MHFISPRRGLAALASVLAVVTLAAPAHAATYSADAVTSILDGTGDVFTEDGAPITDPRVDATAATVEYRPGEIALTLKVAQPVDPRTDPDWVDGKLFAVWLLGTGADPSAELADFGVALLNVDGELVVGVFKQNDMEHLLCSGSGTFDGSTYGAVIASSCLGNPASFRWGAGMFYMVDETPAVDSVPNGDDLLGPILAPPALGPEAGGYWLVGDDGGIFSFNAPFLGSTGNIKLNQPIVGMAADPDKKGYWFVASDGGIFAYDAKFFGSTGAINLNKPIVGMAATPTGQGYWLVASDGGIFSFGDAKFYGSTGALKLNKPIVGMATTPTGAGYWLVASDGGIFSFGDAKFYGSTGSMTLSQPIVGMASTGTGGGYWFVAADGGIFSFGDAKFYGAAVGSSAPVVGMAAAKGGEGYTIVRADGSVVNRGSAPLAGSLVGHKLGRPVVGVAATF